MQAREKVKKKVNQSELHTDAALLVLLCAQLAHIGRRKRPIAHLQCPTDVSELRTEALRARALFESVELTATAAGVQLVFKGAQGGKLNPTQIGQLLLPELLTMLLIEALRPDDNFVTGGVQLLSVSVTAENTQHWEKAARTAREDERKKLVRAVADMLNGLAKLTSESKVVEAGETAAVSAIADRGKTQALAEQLLDGGCIALDEGRKLTLHFRNPVESRENVPDFRLLLGGELSAYPQFVTLAKQYLTSRRVHALGFVAYGLSEASRLRLLELFKPKHEKVFCDHITIAIDVEEGDPLPAPAGSVRVVGYASDDSLECLVVEVNDSTWRTSDELGDGLTFHITLSLGKDRQPRDSNDVLAAGDWIPLVEPVPVETHIVWKPFTG